jgi:hypothetical protein
MKKETLQFLRRQREEIRSDLGLLESGQREVIEISKAGRINVTLRAIQRLLDRLARFEELIAAYEAGLA